MSFQIWDSEADRVLHVFLEAMKISDFVDPEIYIKYVYVYIECVCVGICITYIYA